jgi:hypothetical protein
MGKGLEGSGLVVIEAISWNFPEGIEDTLSNGCHLDVVGGPNTPHDPESDAGGSLSSWQGHPSR